MHRILFINFILKCLIDYIYKCRGQVTTSLSYVNQTDLDSKKIRRMEEAERPQPATIDDPDLDADDIQTLKRRSLYSKVAKQPVRVITDGLSRREASYSVQRVTDNQSNTAGAKSIQAYVVGGRDVLKSWQSTASVVVFVPNSLGWKHKANRLLADEIAFSNQAIVILPDLELSDTKSWEYTLDRLIATMHFSRNEYRPKTISLAGIEEGATVAARAVCDLWDLASYSLSKLPEIAEIHKAGSFTATPLEDTDNDDDDDDDEKTSKPQSSKVGKIILGYAQRIAVQSSRDEDFYSGITFEDDSIKPDDDSSHDTKVSDSNSDSNGDGDEIDDSQSVSNSHSEVAASHEDDITSHKIEHHIDMPSEEPDGEIPAVVDLASAVESEVMDDNASPVDTGALMRELLKELSDSAAATSKLTEASNSKDKAMSSQETARLEQVRARRRALERDLELDATERVENRNLLSAQSTLRPSELALLAPRALLCLCPVKLDINSVAGRLRPPSAFIFHSTSDDR